MPAKKTNPDGSCPLTRAVLAYYESGDEQLLGPVFAGLQKGLKLYTRKLFVQCEQQAEDLVQKTMIDLLRLFRERKFATTLKPGDFPGPGYIWGFAYSVLTLITKDEKRKKTFIDPGSEEDPYMHVAEVTPDSGQTAEGVMVHAEATQIVASVTRAVTQLRPLYRQAVFLVFYKGLTQKEAATHLNITPAPFYRRLQEALGMLRYNLQQQGVRPTPEIYNALRNVDTGNLFEEKERPLSQKQEEHARYIERTAPFRPQGELTETYNQCA